MKRVHAPSSLTRAPLQIPPSHIDKVDTRDKVGSSSFPCQLPPLQSRVDTTVPSVKLPEMLSGELAAAVPLGAPCIMPSPFYDELDSKPSMPNVTSMTEQSHSSAKLETEVKEPEVADIGLQTSLRESQDEGSEEFGGSKAPQSPSTQGLDTEVHVHSIVIIRLVYLFTTNQIPWYLCPGLDYIAEALWVDALTI